MPTKPSDEAPKERFIDTEKINREILERCGIANFSDIQRIESPVVEAHFLDTVETDASALSGRPTAALGVKVSTKLVTVNTYQVATAVPQRNVEELKENFGIDAWAECETAVVHVAQSMAKHYKIQLAELAERSYREHYTRWDRFKLWLYGIFGKTYEKRYRAKDAQELIRHIVAMSNRMFSNNRRGPADFVVCGIKTVNTLMESNSYTMLSDGKLPIPFTGMIYPIGTCAGMKFYVDPYMSYKDHNVYIGRKTGPNDPGLHMYFYGKGTDISLMNYAQDRMSASQKLVAKVRYAITDVGENAHHQYTKLVYR